MLSRLSPLLRSSLHSRSTRAAEPMAARALARAIPSVTGSASSLSLNDHSKLSFSPASLSFPAASPHFGSSILSPAGLSCEEDRKFFLTAARRFGKVFASGREYRKTRRKPAPRRREELELNVKICIEEQLPDDPEILVYEMLMMFRLIACLFVRLNNHLVWMYNRLGMNHINGWWCLFFFYKLEVLVLV